MDSVPDEKVTVEYIKGADSAVLLKTVYDEYGDFLYWIIFKQLNRDVERSNDVFNELFAELAKKDCHRIRMFKGRSSFRTYMASVWKNMLIDLLRREEKMKRVDYVEPDIIDLVALSGDISGSPEHDFIKNENDAVMRKLLKEAIAGIAKLSPEEKMVLRLRIIMNRKFEEINRMTGIKNSNHVFRSAMQKVRNSMDEGSRGIFLDIIEER